MAFDQNDDLPRALAALKVTDIWAEAFSQGVVTVPPPTRDGLVESPFRNDGKHGSFSICHDCHGYRDFGGDGVSGGPWKFHELCWPNLPKGERAKELIGLAVRLGCITVSVAKPSSQPGVDARMAKAVQSLERRDALRKAEDRIYEQRDAALRPPDNVKPLQLWPDFVRARWEEGVKVLRDDRKRIEELAASRGWPIEWVWWLLEADLLSYPWERWTDGGEKWSKRQKAFRVDVPKITGTAAALDPVGYHQRFFIPPRDGAKAEKKWLFIPGVPRDEPKSQFERELELHGAALGSTADHHEALVPPLPFVLGDLNAPKVLVLLEGQWDAISFFGACGWFHDTSLAAGIAVMGIRGVHGIDPFLGYWRAWLARVRPRVWLIADNDSAGRAWREQPQAERGKIRMPSLADRLKAAGCRDVVVSWLTPGQWGKDFNDYYKAAKPTVEAMHRWLRKVGLLTESGGWA